MSMLSERVLRRIERLLDEADAAVDHKDWGAVRENARAVLALDPANADAHAFLQAAERAIGAEPSAQSSVYRRVFVGREGELHQLERAFDAALAGQGVLAMVSGEPGIGKTALCEQLASYVAVRG